MSVMIRSIGEPGDLGWVVLAHGELYAREFGWDTSFEALVARIVADWAAQHDDATEAAWVAELDGRRVGCVFCVREDITTARLRILLVDPSARGRGVGRRLVRTCLDFARAAGYRRAVLWANHPPTPPPALYSGGGFPLTPPEAPHNYRVGPAGQK